MTHTFVPPFELQAFVGAGGFALPPVAFVGGRELVLLVEFVGRGEPAPLLVGVVGSGEFAVSVGSGEFVVLVGSGEFAVSVGLGEFLVSVGPGASVVPVGIAGPGVFVLILLRIVGPDGNGNGDGDEPDVGSTRFNNSSGCPGRN